MRNSKLKVLALAVAIAGACSAQASLLTFDLDTASDGSPVSGNVLVTITEAATAGDVHMNISNFAAGFLNEMFFNYASALTGGQISNFLATSGTVGTPSVKSNGTQGFSFILDFPNQPGPNFISGESVSFDFSANADLNVSGFNVLGSGPSGDDFYVAAHLNATGNSKIGNVSGGVLETLPVGEGPVGEAPVALPEPNVALLLGLGLVGIPLVSRRRPVGLASLVCR